MKLRWSVLQQKPDRGVHRLRSDQVVVVEDEQPLVRRRVPHHIVDQGGHQRLEGRRRWRAGQRAHSLADRGAHRLQRHQRVAPEPDRVVVASIERQPTRRPCPAPGPLREQHSLAVAGRSDDNDDPIAQPVVEPLSKSRPGDQAGSRPGHMQLGRQQEIPLRSGHLRPGRRRCLRSHQEPSSRTSSDAPRGCWRTPP